MWNASMAAVIALLALGMSMASGEGVRGETDRVEPPAPARPADQRGPAGEIATSQANAPQAGSARLVALVIGNGAYPDADLTLNQPVSRARALADELESRGAGVKLIILDASRGNPFERRFRGFSAGLAGIYAPDDTLVMYSAAPG